MPKVEKLTLSRSRDIPFDKLVPSDRNVRRVRAGVSIEELAEDIAARTLLQSLSVRPIADREGFYEVQTGGRRYRALELLVKQKRLAKNTPIPCIIREDGVLEEDSLAENVQRVNLHPLDQFRAFQALRERGLGDEEIAARFFVTPTVVRQRLKLVSVSPKLLDFYGQDEMSLEQLMSFTVSDDPARQEQVWEAVQRDWNKEPYRIKKLLTDNVVRATDKRARFVGVVEYEAAGGVVLRDLFASDDGGWLQSTTLLEKLVAEKLHREVESVRTEGWKWVDVAADFPYGHTAGLRRIKGEEESLTDDECAARDALRQEMEEIERNYSRDGDDLPEEIDRRLFEIEAALDAFEDRMVRYDPADIARAGAFVSIDGDGALRVERGYVRPEDEAGVVENGGDIDGAEDGGQSESACHIDDGDRKPDRNSGKPSVATTGADAETEEDGLKPLSERLVMELTAHHTLALRDALAKDPRAAFLAVLHALVLQSFYRYATESCLEITAKSSGFSVQGPDLEGSPSTKSVDARHESWTKQLPEEPENLWDTLRALDNENRTALFAHCASLTVNAIHEPWNRTPGRRRHADQLAGVLMLDMAAAGWKPTAENYLNRVPKARILEAVREAKGAAAADLISHLKKSDMAHEGERLLADSAWLPELLRTPGSGRRVDEAAPAEATAAELPAFLGAAE
ncbi:MAG: DNA-binding protein [Methylocystaceae bacterium]|nr:MAG: DNA-binding protein [Methylocystaceae bacterium]